MPLEKDIAEIEAAFASGTRADKHG
jgi:hypothetical protein